MKNFKETFLLFRSQEHIWLAVKAEVVACGQKNALQICPLREARKGSSEDGGRAKKTARREKKLKGKRKKEGEKRL